MRVHSNDFLSVGLSVRLQDINVEYQLTCHSANELEVGEMILVANSRVRIYLRNIIIVEFSATQATVYRELLCGFHNIKSKPQTNFKREKKRIFNAYIRLGKVNR